MAEVKRAASQIISLAPTEERKTAPTNYSTYLRMYKAHPIVRSAIDKIAKTAAATGYQFVSRDSKVDGNETNIAKLDEIFHRSRGSRLLVQTYTDLLIFGDAYWYVLPARNGEPFQLRRVAPSSVTIVMDKVTGDVTKYITRDSQGKETQFDAIDFVHFRISDPNNDVYGLSPLESLQSTVAQDLFAQTYNESFFANSAQTGVIFNMRGASREEVERNREFLKKEYVGQANAHKPLLLEGDVDVSRSVASPAEMQFIDGRKQLMSEILAVFDLPYTKLGGATETANRSQSSENDKSFKSETIQPLQTLVAEVVNEDLIWTTFSIEDTVFIHRDIDQRDEADRMALYLQGLNGGVYTLNYVRNLLGLPPVEGGDEPFIQTPLGLMPVSMVKEAALVTLEAKTKNTSAPQGFSTPGAPMPANAPDAPTDSGATNG